MARSRHVYVVLHEAVVPPVAAFTVKHELVGWLKRSERVLDGLSVYRVHDGGYPAGHDKLSIDELLASDG